MSTDVQTKRLNDPRAERSRTALLRATFVLLKSEADLPDLTVAKIVREAGVTRPTFYQHFASVSQLVNAALISRLQEVLDRIQREAPNLPLPARMKWTLRCLIGHLYAERIYAKVLRTLAAPEILAELVTFVAARLGSEQLFLSEDSQNHPYPKQFAEFLAAGAIWLVWEWLIAPTDSVEDVTERVTTSLLVGMGGMPQSEGGVR
ncbi:MAG: TetR/AcrR family transcriptional regulator [Actinomycetaceae bacterium]|nr:TetR/AcrR family transcriptional regulator [Actinomycetaceae bacterium]